MVNHLCVCVCVCVCVDAVESVALLPVFYHSFRFVACIVWHVIPASVLSHSQMSDCSCAGGGDADCHRNVSCDSVQSPSLPPNLQVVQHDGIGEAPYELLHPCWGSGDDGGGAPLLWYSCEGGPCEGMAPCHQLLWQAPT